MEAGATSGVSSTWLSFRRLDRRSGGAAAGVSSRSESGVGAFLFFDGLVVGGGGSNDDVDKDNPAECLAEERVTLDDIGK